MGSDQEELAEKLKNVGNLLLKPPDAVDEVLTLLDKAEDFLSKVEQAPSYFVKNSLVPLLKALTNDALLKHSNVDVHVSTISCITEVTRITAPDAPFDDDVMKEIFHFTVAAFEKLSHLAGRCYSKAISILQNVGRVRSSLVMLDLECDDLIVQMFQTFLKVVRPSHPDNVFSSMEAIMTVTLVESEEISPELLQSLLDSVKKENQKLSPASWNLGEQVIENCGRLLAPCLSEAIESNSITISDYSPRVISLCCLDDKIKPEEKMNIDDSFQDDKLQPQEKINIDVPCQVVGEHMPDSVRMEEACPIIQTSKDNKSPMTSEACQTMKSRVNSSTIKKSANIESTEMERSEFELKAIPEKRVHKPNRLMKPDEGYDNSWIDSGRKSRRMALQKRRGGREINSFSSKTIGTGETPLPLESEKDKNIQASTHQTASSGYTDPPNDMIKCKVGHRKKRGAALNQEADPDLESGPKENSGVLLEGKKNKTTVSLKKDVKSGRGKKGTGKTVSPASETEAIGTQLDAVQPNRSVISPSSEEKYLMQPDMLVSKNRLNNSGEKETSLQTNDTGKKRRRLFKSSDKKDNVHSGDKKLAYKSATKLSYKDEIQASPDIKTKRQCTQVKEEDVYLSNSGKKKKYKGFGMPEMPDDIRDLGTDLIGRMIKVWWPMDKRFYEGLVSAFNDSKKKHQVLYKDGDEELLNLNKERWELIDMEMSDDEGQNAIFSSSNASSNVLKRKNSDKKLKDSSNRPKGDSSSKRFAPTATRKSIGHRTKSDCKYVKAPASPCQPKTAHKFKDAASVSRKKFPNVPELKGQKS